MNLITAFSAIMSARKEIGKALAFISPADVLELIIQMASIERDKTKSGLEKLHAVLDWALVKLSINEATIERIKALVNSLVYLFNVVGLFRKRGDK